MSSLEEPDASCEALVGFVDLIFEVKQPNTRERAQETERNMELTARFCMAKCALDSIGSATATISWMRSTPRVNGLIPAAPPRRRDSMKVSTSADVAPAGTNGDYVLPDGNSTHESGHFAQGLVDLSHGCALRQVQIQAGDLGNIHKPVIAYLGVPSAICA